MAADRPPYQPKNEKSVDRANRLWTEWLDHRRPYENLWRRATNQYLSKFEKPTKGRSQFYLDLTRSQVRTYASQIDMNLFGEIPYVEFEPYGQEDITAVKVSEAVVHWAMTSDRSGFRDEMLNTILGAFIYGFSVQKHTYETFVKTYNIGGEEIPLIDFEGIYYSGRSPWRVVVSPNAYNFAHGRVGGLFDTEPRAHVERLLELEKQGRLTNVKKNLDKLAYGWCDMMRDSSGDPAEKDFNNRDQSKDGLVYIREFWDEDRNELTIIGNHDVELFHGKISLLGGIPFTCFSLQNVPWQVMAMGIPEQLKYPQEYLNLNASLNATERLRNALPPTFIQQGMGLKSKLLRLEPDDIVEVPGIPRDAVYTLDRPARQAEYWADINQGQEWAQKSTGLALATEGMEAGRGTTATSSSLAANAAYSFIRFMTGIFSQRVGQMALHNLKTLHQFMPPRLMRVALSNELESHAEYVNANAMALEVIPKIRDRSHTESRFQDQQSYIALTPLLMPFFTGQMDAKTGSIIPPTMNSQEWFQILFKVFQVKNWQRIFSQPPQENNPFAQMQMMGQMQGQGAFRSPNQPQAVPQGESQGNLLGQLMSRLSPGSNNNPGAGGINNGAY